ncbi:MAG: cellulose binding domain-containing protein, partial [Lachnospiraceae bacterium]
MRKGVKKTMVFLLTLVMCFSMTGVNAYAEETGSVVESTEKNWEDVTTVNSYVGDNYNVTFSLMSYWEGGYNANVKIENTGDIVIQNWYLNYDLNNLVTSMWNAEVCSYESGRYTVKNAGWNADIPVGGNVEFGFSVNENFNGFPNTYDMLGVSSQVKEETYTIEYCLDSEWGDGFTGRITISNNSEQLSEDWT